MSRLFDAIEFAAHAHAEQYRKGTRIPYIIHPLNVMRLLIEAGCDEDTVVAGLLHDTVEDTSVTSDEIRSRFGDIVADLVAGVTEPPRAFTWEQRKQAVLNQLAHAPCAVLWLECADKYDNLRQVQQDEQALGDAFWERFNRPKIYQHWYAASLARVFKHRADCDTPNHLFVEYETLVLRVYGDLNPPASLPDSG